MDILSIGSLMPLNTTGSINASSLTGSLYEKADTADGTLFDAVLNSAINSINETNGYISDMENEEIRFALGETENTHDLTIAMQKASTAIQYTVAVRDKLLEAYKEIMNMQI